MSALATKHNAINLSQGFPEFNPPAGLIDKVNESLLGGKNQYSPMAGQMSLREVIAERQNSWGRSFAINPETDITIVPGATAGLFAVFQAFVHQEMKSSCLIPLTIAMRLPSYWQVAFPSESR